MTRKDALRIGLASVAKRLVALERAGFDPTLMGKELRPITQRDITIADEFQERVRAPIIWVNGRPWNSVTQSPIKDIGLRRKSGRILMRRTTLSETLGSKVARELFQSGFCQECLPVNMDLAQGLFSAGTKVLVDSPANRMLIGKGRRRGWFIATSLIPAGVSPECKPIMVNRYWHWVLFPNGKVWFSFTKKEIVER